MKTSIVIATYNKLEYTQQCIESIRNYTENGTYEIIVVDNNSTDKTVAWLSEQNDIKLIINQENLGFPKACNQGIEIANGDNILLLNNDTIVTSNWLTNMITCLYSDEKIGAVGPVTNNISYHQRISVNYETLDEMHGFATLNNILEPSKWEECLHLVGFCLLIKTSLIKEIGILDEIFTPGNYEDDDYSLRVRLAGYKMMICRDTFIHHYGSASFKDNATKDKYNRLLKTNREKFIDKWNFNSDLSHVIRQDLVDLIDGESDKPIRILDIGCLCGGTLLRVKHLFPLAELYGVESNSMCVQVASHFANVAETPHQFEQGFFDYILLSDSTLLNDMSPEQLLKKYQVYLRQDGYFLTSIPNILNYKVIKSFITGTASNEQKNQFNLSEIERFFNDAEYGQVDITAVTSSRITTLESEFIDRLVHLVDLASDTAYKVEKFLIKASIQNQIYKEIIHLLNECNTDSAEEVALQKLLTFDSGTLVATINRFSSNPLETFNQLAVILYHHGHHENVLLYLNQAHNLNAKDNNTLYNLGYILYRYGEHQSALYYLNQISERNEDLGELIKQVELTLKVSNSQARNVLHLLRRIEFDIDRDETVDLLVTNIRSGVADAEKIINLIDTHIIHKSDVLNSIACICFNNGLLDGVIPLLEQSLKHEPSHEETLSSLGIVLYQLGEYQSALSFLKRKVVIDVAADELIASIQGMTK